MRFTRRGILPLLIAAIALASLAGPVPPSEAVGWDGSCDFADDGELRFGFTGAGWIVGSADRRYGTNTSINAVAFANQWESVKDEQAANAVNMVEAWGDLTVIFADVSPNLGTINCGSGTLKLDWSLASNSKWKEFRSVFLHELGHAMDLSHAHKEPVWDGQIGVMATCLGSQRKDSQLSQDDSSALTRRHVGPTTSNINPNAGFERSDYGWGNVAGWTVTTTHLERSGHKARYLGSGAITQTYITASDQAGHNLQAQVYARDATSGIYGKVRLEAIELLMDYGPNNTNCNWSSTRNENNNTAAPYAWTLRASTTAFPNSSSYKLLSTSVTSTAGLVTLEILRVHNETTGGVRIDDARLYWY